MTGPIEYEPSRDPLYRDAPTPHHASIPVLGIPVHFASNAPEVIAVVEEAFQGWRTLKRVPHVIESREVTVTIVVQPGDEGEADRVEIHHRVLSGGRLLFGSRSSMGLADPERGEATGFVTPQLVSDRQTFRYKVVEALTLSLVTPRDRQPLHAAALVRDGAAVVVTGPSGMGKSTLAYAAARQGIPVLAEDTVHLQSRPGLRVWGLPGFLHLPLDSHERFPELRGVPPTLTANGRKKLAVGLRELDALPPLPFAEKAVLCLLARGDQEPRVKPIDPDAAVGRLMQDVEPGFDMFEQTIKRPLELLAGYGAWELSLPEHPANAIPALEQLMDRARER